MLKVEGLLSTLKRRSEVVELLNIQDIGLNYYLNAYLAALDPKRTFATFKEIQNLRPLVLVIHSKKNPQ